MSNMTPGFAVSGTGGGYEILQMKVVVVVVVY